MSFLELLIDTAGDKALVGSNIKPLHTVLYIGARAFAGKARAVKLGVVGRCADIGNIDVKGNILEQIFAGDPGVAAVVADQIPVSICMHAGLLRAAACHNAGVAVVLIIDRAPQTPGVIGLGNIVSVLDILIAVVADPVAGVALSLAVCLHFADQAQICVPGH